MKSPLLIEPELKNTARLIRNSVRQKDIRLLSVNSDPKTIKGFNKKGFLTGVLYLAPYNLSGKNVCPMASKDCAAACLHTAGNQVFLASKTKSRINKTQWFFGNPNAKMYNHNDEPTRQGFLHRIKREILALKTLADEHGLKCAIRLNGTSDIGWQHILRDFILANPDITFYDYTKVYQRAKDSLNESTIHQTFSRHEDNQDQTLEFLSLGGMVAVVFDKLPLTWHGYAVLDGDTDDLRFLNGHDKLGTVIGLKAKGKARNQYKADKLAGLLPEAKFVVRASEIEGFPCL
jgi:hypothetical protein